MLFTIRRGLRIGNQTCWGEAVEMSTNHRLYVRISTRDLQPKGDAVFTSPIKRWRLIALSAVAGIGLIASACVPPDEGTPPTTTVPEVPVCAEVPDAPVMSIMMSNEVIPFTIQGDGPIETAFLNVDDDLESANWVQGSSVALEGRSGDVRLVARSADDCVATDIFDSTFEVRDSYPGRPGLEGSDSNAISQNDPSIEGWAVKAASYVPGADVSANWHVPINGAGPANRGLLPLGNAGEVTMTFSAPIVNGDGPDFAVFENGFYQNNTSELLFIEYGWVEVSTDGENFVRFDNSSQWPDPVGAFAFADPRTVNGLAGRDGAGWGTPFDLEILKNKREVREGILDLNNINFVRIVDIVGASDYPNQGDEYLDSFGRQIFDTHLTVGSGGFDLTGIAALNMGSAYPYTEGVCSQFESGVTTIVDFAGFDGAPQDVISRCAIGAQANGQAVLDAVEIPTTDESGPGTVCTIGGFPQEGFPFCWLTGGYWSYWLEDPETGSWRLSPLGLIGVGERPVGGADGWVFQHGFEWRSPSVNPDGSPAEQVPEPDWDN